MNNLNWQRWLGLPHELGADPDDGRGADCAVMTFKVLEAAGVPHEAFNREWLALAQRGEDAPLLALWERHTERLSEPEPLALALTRGPCGLGMGVVLDGGLLTVHHQKGVCWVPLWLLRPMEWRRPRHVAR